MPLTPGQMKLMSIWGSIEEAVARRVSTADLWTAARAAAEREQVSLAGVSASDMSGLRGLAAGIRNAAHLLSQGDLSGPVLGGMVAQTPWSRGLGEQNALGMWQVRYQHTVVEDGEQVTVWRTSIFERGLPPTIAELQQAVTEDAQAVADSHGTTHVGIDGLQVLAV